MTVKPARTPALPAFTPVPRRPRSTGFTPARQRRFIEALADYGSVRAAANSVGLTPESAYQLRRHPQAKEFRKAWEVALALGVQRLEDIAMERALNGVETPVYSYGKLVGTRRVYNDRLLMFMLRNRAGKRFAAGLARPDAVTKARLRKLKEQWRAEWEAERNDPAEVARVRARIEAKLARLRDQVLARRAAEAAEAGHVAGAQTPAHAGPLPAPARSHRGQTPSLLTPIQPGPSFQANLALLPPLAGVQRVDLVDTAGALVGSIESQPGRHDALAVFAYLAKAFPTLDAAAASHALAVFAEHAPHARARPGAHPHVDRLLAIATGAEPLRIVVTAISGTPTHPCGTDPTQHC